ncbi:MAG TPA: tetratricopeptide repeat protein [Chryseolinea sp.]
MENKTTPNAGNSSLKSKIYFILGYCFLMAMALSWSIDDSIVYIFFGVAFYFLFMGFYSMPFRKNFQGPFESSNRTGPGASPLWDAFAKAFQRPGSASKAAQKPFTKTPAPEVHRKVVGLVVGGIFVTFFIFFFGSIFSGSSPEWDDSVISFQEAEQNFWSGNYDSAYVNYRQAWKADDQYKEAMVGYGKVLAIRDQHDSARIMFDMALAIDPDYKEAAYNKALAFYNQEDYDEAIALLAQILQKNEDYYEAAGLLGDSYYAQKQFDQAISWYSKVYENEGYRTRFLCHVMAYIFDTQGDYSRAIDLYKEALEYDSSVVDIYVRLGELLPGDEGNYYRTQAAKLKQN